MGLLDGKVAVITGAGSGMAKASTKVFVREGAKVVAADISGAEKDTAAEVGEGVLPVHCDVTEEADVEAMIQAALDEFGRVDAVLNVAGIGSPERIHDLSMEVYDQTMDVNLRGVLLGMKYGIRAMLETGGGAIVNWSSVGGLDASTFGTATYSASKAGVIAVTKAAAVEYGHRASANAICPGFIQTEIMGARAASTPGCSRRRRSAGPASRPRWPKSRRSSSRTGPRSSAGRSSRSTAGGPPSSRDRRHHATDGMIGEAAATRYAGARINRVEDARLLTGHGTYVDDISLPGMLHASFVRSPFARAAIRGIDTSAAAAVPGVRCVFTAADLNPGAKEQWHTSVGPDEPGDAAPAVGRGGGALRRRPGRTGRRRQPLPRRGRRRAGRASTTTRCRPSSTTPRPRTPKRSCTSATAPTSSARSAGPPASALEEVFASAAHVVHETIYQQAYAAVPMEGRGLVVDYSRATGDLTIYSATQSPHEVRLFCSRLLGIPEHRIRVVMRDTGGGFGQKIMVQRDEMCLMLAAPKVGAPVKWVEDRNENLLAAGQSRHEHAAVAMAFDADGAIQAAQIDFVSDSGAYPTPWPVSTSAVVGALFPGPYRVPRASFTAKTMYTNTVGRAAYRGPWQFESLAREVLLDIAARQMGMDPAELRRRNLLRADELPYTSANGMPYDSISPLSTLEQALSMLDYEAFREEQAAARAVGRYLGVGLSTYVEPSTPGFGAYATEAATIRIEPSGKVNVYIAGGSTGNSIETTVVQLAADALGVEHRRRRDHPGRHGRDRFRGRRGREPERFDDGRCGARDGNDPARAHPRPRRPQAGSGGRGHRAGEQSGERAGNPVDHHLPGRARRARLLRPVLAAPGRARGPRGERAVHGRDALRSG